MNVGELSDGLDWDMMVRTKNGGLYMIHTQMIQCVDRDGQHNGSYGVSIDRAVEMLRKYGTFVVASDFDGTNPCTVKRKDVSEIYSVHTRNNGPIVVLDKPKKSQIGRLAERITQLFH